MRRLHLFVLLSILPAFAQPLTPAPTVILVNGYQAPPCGGVTAEDTFGQLAQKLRDLGRTVEFFNNCSVPASRRTSARRSRNWPTRWASASPRSPRRRSMWWRTAWAG